MNEKLLGLLVLGALLLSCGDSTQSDPDPVCEGPDCPMTCPDGSPPNADGECVTCNPSFRRTGLFAMERGGRDVVAYQDRLYMTPFGFGLVAFDVSTPSRAVQIDSLDTGPTTALEIHEGWLYAVGDAVRIIDISGSDPLEEVATLNPPGTPTAIAFSGNVAYTVSLTGGFRTFDITDPRAPSPLGSADIDGGMDITVRGSLAYVAAGADLFIVDVSNPALPVSVGTFPFATLGPAESVLVNGDYAYVGTSFGGTDGRLFTIDVSEPSSPGPATMSDFLGSPVTDLSLEGDALYAAASNAGVLVFDLQTPSEPSLATSLDTLLGVQAIESNEGIAYAPLDNSYVAVLDVSTPLSPVEVRSTLARMGSQSLTVLDDVVYLGTRDALWTFDVSGASDPELLGLAELPTIAFDVAVDGNLAFVALRELGVAVVDVSDPDAPVLQTTVDTPSAALRVSASGPLAFATTEFDGLIIIDASNAAMPSIISGFNVDRAEDVVVREDVAYVSASSGRGFISIDVSDPTMPRMLSSVPANSGVHDLFDISLLGGFAYIEDFSGNFMQDDGIAIIDVSDPSNMELIRSAGSLSQAAIAADDRYLYRSLRGLFDDNPRLEVTAVDVDDFTRIRDLDLEDGVIFRMVADEQRVYGLQLGGGLVGFSYEDCQ